MTLTRTPDESIGEVQVCEAMAEAFVAAGTDVLFTLFGDGNLGFVDAFAAQPGTRVVHARHEAAAVFMASGHARATGRVGLVSVTAGPGLTHIGTPLVAASRARLPLVVYAGDTVAAGPRLGGLQQLDQRAFADAVECLFLRVDRDNARDAAARAVELAREHRRPVIVSVPEDLMDKPLLPGGAVEAAQAPATVQPDRPVHLDPVRVATAAVRVDAALRAASSPLLVVGSGVTDDEVEQVRSLAERYGALVGTTFRAKGRLDHDEYSVGIVGPLAHAAHQAAQESADLVVGFGANLHGFGSFIDTLYGTPTLSVGAERYGAWAPPHVEDTLIDARPGDVLAALAELPGAPAPRPRTPQPSREEAVAADFAELPEAAERGLLDPRRLVLELDGLIPDDAIVVIGGGHFWSWPIQYLSKRRRDFVFPIEFGSIGMGLPTAIGIAASGLGRPVYLVEGDGGVTAGMQELESVVRSGLDLTAVIVNDAALGAEYHKLKAKGLSVEESYYECVDFAGLAELFGGRGARVDDVAAIRSIMASGGTGLRVLDARVTRAVTSRWYRRLYLGEIGRLAS